MTVRRSTGRTPGGAIPDRYDVVAWHLDGENDVHPAPTSKMPNWARTVGCWSTFELPNAPVDDSVVCPDTIVHDGESRSLDKLHQK